MAKGHPRKAAIRCHVSEQINLGIGELNWSNALSNAARRKVTFTRYALPCKETINPLGSLKDSFRPLPLQVPPISNVATREALLGHVTDAGKQHIRLRRLSHRSAT